jgi:hypothetical protein
MYFAGASSSLLSASRTLSFYCALSLFLLSGHCSAELKCFHGSSFLLIIVAATFFGTPSADECLRATAAALAGSGRGTPFVSTTGAARAI